MNQRDLEIVGQVGSPEIAEVFVARMKSDPTQMLEFVDGLDSRHPRREKWIINVSTQFGCPVGCLFCDASGTFRGNVPAATLLEQIDCVLERHPGNLRTTCKKLKIHFARMGEPSLNPDVPVAIERLKEGYRIPGLWICVASVFPRGREAWFEHLTEVKNRCFHGRFQLQVSMNTTDQAERQRLIPIPLCDFPTVAKLATSFWRPGDRKIVLNYALIEGQTIDPNRIFQQFDPGIFAVKLTPLNPTFARNQNGLTDAYRKRDQTTLLGNQLNAAGYDVVLSVGDPRENEVQSNCGQAVRSFLSTRAADGCRKSGR